MFHGGSPSGFIHPFFILKFISSTILSESINKFVPRPSQFSHAPSGELNEKCRGSN